MGFIEKLRGELIDIVEWVDDSQRTLVWRYPRYHNQIKHGAQLIVRPGQTAVFVRQGRIADVFGPGQHELVTRNLPVLSSLAGWKYGFDSPFKAEVYFVRTTQITDLKWGTPNPVMMRDADFGPVRVRAFGTYTLKAVDPKALLEALVGTDGQFDAEEITELLRSIVASAFADVVASSELSVLDFASNYAMLGDKVRTAAVARVDDEYGLDLPQLIIVNISLPSEVEKALDARSSMGVLGDLGAFQAYQLGHAMPVAAANPAGGLAGAGVGVGMGLAMAQHVAPGAAAPAAPQAPPPPPAAWHVAVGGQASGPFAFAQLAPMVAQGALRPDTLVWTAGMQSWAPARSVAQLTSLFAGAPPPLPSAG